MPSNVSVFRTEESISEAVETLKELKHRAECCGLSNQSLCFNQELIQRWELDNLLSVAMVICEAARARKESRGAHFRDDYPKREDTYNYHTLVSMSQYGDVTLSRREIDRTLFFEGQKHHEKFDFIERKY